MRGLTGINRRRVLRAIASTVGAIAIGSSIGSAETCDIVVNDDEDGYTSIQDAVDNAKSGDVICVKPGTYNEQVDIGKSLTIRGKPGGSSRGPGDNPPVLDGEGETESAAFQLFHGSAATDVTIEGFEIKNYGVRPSEGQWGTGVQPNPNNSNIVIRHNFIHDMGSAGVGVDGDGFDVKNNVFEKVAGTAVNVPSPASDVEIVDNTIIGGKANTSGEPVSDPRTDRHSNIGVFLHSKADLPPGESTVIENVLIENNDVKGPMDSSGIYLLSINPNDPDDNTSAIIRKVDIRDNNVRRIHGTEDITGKAFRLAANPLEGAEVRVDNVEYAENTAADSQVGFTAGTRFKDGITNVDYKDNTAQNLDANGFVIGGLGKGRIRDVLYESNEVENTGQNGLLIRATGSSTVTDITYRRTTVRDASITGWRVKTRDSGAVSSVVFDDNKVTGTSSGDSPKPGVELRPRSSGAISDITIKNSDLSSNDIGVWASSRISDAFASILIENTELRDNKTGMLLNGGASGNPFNLRQNNIVGNDNFGVKNGADSAGIILAENNWWGDKSGPTRKEGKSGRTVGEGDRVSDGVDFRPWLTSSS